MRVLITGVCGFAGSIIALGLREIRPEWRITGIDNLMRAGSERNRQMLRQRGVRVVHGDMRNFSDLDVLTEQDWILDAAANPSVLAGADGKASSRQLVEHNLMGSLNLLELAKKWRSGFVMLSTSRVYSIKHLAEIPMGVEGDRFRPAADTRTTGLTDEGVSEEFSTEPPLSLYGSTKRASELLALEYANMFDLPVYVNRCGVLAGAGQFGKVDQGIFSYWIHSWARRRPLRYLGFAGSGRQVRDCLHARDLLSLLIAQLEHPQIEGVKLVNVAGGMRNSASLSELSDWCRERFGAHEIDSDPAERPFDVPWLVLDSAVASRTWAWKPQTSLPAIWEEIAIHAEQNPNWLELTSDE